MAGRLFASKINKSLSLEQLVGERDDAIHNEFIYLIIMNIVFYLPGDNGLFSICHTVHSTYYIM